MTKDNIKHIEQRIIKILADKLDIDEKKIKPESKLVEDLGMDSFGAVELAFELKEAFNIDIPIEELSDVKDVEDIAKKIITKKGQEDAKSK